MGGYWLAIFGTHLCCLTYKRNKKAMFGSHAWALATKEDGRNLIRASLDSSRPFSHATVIPETKRRDMYQKARGLRVCALSRLALGKDNLSTYVCVYQKSISQYKTDKGRKQIAWAVELVAFESSARKANRLETAQRDEALRLQQGHGRAIIVVRVRNFD
ncbi:hypothetical protein QAD02_003734 [Eretmocerus hayati]|uniref:Uncharacterized protein n=1 Tax=Eretmocerus hayati TaxID=131215 RepID=A0ACC2NMJ5_9HYME|nr:hypothetical protein QAD02_003734 [Eretmocerus hayati]